MEVENQRGSNGASNGSSNGGKILGGVTGRGFLPGKSGNPKGRPPLDRSLTELLREILEQNEIGGKKLPDGKRVKNLVAEALVKQALKGGSRHIVEIYNRVDGKVTEKVEHSGLGGGPIAVDAAVCGLSEEQVDTWREKKRAEIAARPTGPPD